MRKSCVVLFVALVMFSFNFARTNDLELKQGKLSFGESAFTSGTDISLTFQKGNNSFQLTGNSQRFFGAYFWENIPKLSIGFSAGSFKNTPWAGPYVIYSPVKYLTFLYWAGWKSGKVGYPGKDVGFMFHTPGVILSMEKVSVNWIYANFLGEKTHIPGISYTIPVNSHFLVKTNFDYQTSLEKVLLSAGITYFF